MPFLKTKISAEHTRITGDYQLDGQHMAAKRKPSKVIYKWLKAMSSEFARIESSLNDFVDGRIVTKRTDFLTEWEKAAGIPDQSFPAIGTAVERQYQVVGKLSSEGISTAEEMEWLLSVFGFVVDVKPGYYFIVNPDSRVIFPPGAEGEREARFTVVFDVDFDASIPENVPNFFPVSFPWEFRSNNYNAASFFITNFILPANVNGLWINAGYSPPEYYISTPNSGDAYVSTPDSGDAYVSVPGS